MLQRQRSIYAGAAGGTYESNVASPGASGLASHVCTNQNNTRCSALVSENWYSTCSGKEACLLKVNHADTNSQEPLHCRRLLAVLGFSTQWNFMGRLLSRN